VTLGDLTLPIDLEQARGLALVFTAELAGPLAAIHSQYGTPNCAPIPRSLTDGRMVLGADLLTEVEPGGLLYDMWQHADQAALRAAVQVMPWADVVPLLPTDLDPL
jgi:hypothetical protein